MSSPGTRLRLTVEGIVQGVGFRPFLHRLAEQYGIRGWVRNTSQGLEGVLTGSSPSLEKFLAVLEASPPPMARIDRVTAVPEDGDREYSTFSIRDSRISPENCTPPPTADTDIRLSTVRTAVPGIRSSGACPMTGHGL